MGDISDKIEQLEESLRRQQKQFLMEHYAQRLMEQLEGEVDDLDDETVDSLLAARLYASSEMAAQITRILASQGRDQEWEPACPDEAITDLDPDGPDEASNAGVLFDNGANGDPLFASDDEDFEDEEQEDADDLIADRSAAGVDEDGGGKESYMHDDPEMPEIDPELFAEEEDEEGDETPGFEAKSPVGKEEETKPGFERSGDRSGQEATPGFESSGGPRQEETASLDANRGTRGATPRRRSQN